MYQRHLLGCQQITKRPDKTESLYGVNKAGFVICEVNLVLTEKRVDFTIIKLGLNELCKKNMPEK